MHKISVAEAIQTRRSIRKFNTEVPVPMDTVIKLLELANRAPSSNNTTPWKFGVVSREHMHKIKPALYGNASQADTASHFIIVIENLEWLGQAIKTVERTEAAGTMSAEVGIRSRKNLTFLSDHYKANPETGIRNISLDLGIVTGYLTLSAMELGLGSCVIGGADFDKVAELLTMGPTLKPVALIAIGIPDEIGHETLRPNVLDVTYLG